MIAIVSRAQARAFDAQVIGSCSIPGLVLMENAGRGAADALTARVPRRASVLVLCGGGNNGGDGYVMARRLRTLGHPVEVLSTREGDALTGDARINHDAWLGIGGQVLFLGAEFLGARAAIGRAAVLVDALFGTGLDRPIGGILAQLIELMNDSHKPIYALDIPSGIHADNGQVQGVAARATATFTFAAAKLGLYTTVGREHSGEIVEIDIGVPQAAGQGLEVSARGVAASDVALALDSRSPGAHKGSAGRVLVVAGSEGKTGAALLSGRGALRGGAGLVTLCSFTSAVQGFAPQVMELMTALIDPVRPEVSLTAHVEGKDAVVLGPGLGLDARARRAVEHLALGWEGKLVLDADALTHFAGRAEQLKTAPGELLLTPHPGEAARLLGCSVADIEADRFAALAQLVSVTGACVLLKGPHTLVGAPGELPWVNTSGNAVLATAGSGDVLAGLCGALAATHSIDTAAWMAAFLHGVSGDLWARAQGADRGLMARELADGLPGAFASLQNDKLTAQ